jgi:hypothetical protein
MRLAASADSRENVNRSLGQLVTLGALEMEGGHFTILDSDRLKSCSES